MTTDKESVRKYSREEYSDSLSVSNPFLAKAFTASEAAIQEGHNMLTQFVCRKFPAQPGKIQEELVQKQWGPLEKVLRSHVFEFTEWARKAEREPKGHQSDLGSMNLESSDAAQTRTSEIQATVNQLNKENMEMQREIDKINTELPEKITRTNELDQENSRRNLRNQIYAAIYEKEFAEAGMVVALSTTPFSVDASMRELLNIPKETPVSLGLLEQKLREFVEQEWQVRMNICEKYHLIEGRSANKALLVVPESSYDFRECFPLSLEEMSSITDILRREEMKLLPAQVENAGASGSQTPVSLKLERNAGCGFSPHKEYVIPDEPDEAGVGTNPSCHVSPITAPISTATTPPSVARRKSAHQALRTHRARIEAAGMEKLRRKTEYGGASGPICELGDRVGPIRQPLIAAWGRRRATIFGNRSSGSEDRDLMRSTSMTAKLVNLLRDKVASSAETSPNMKQPIPTNGLSRPSIGVLGGGKTPGRTSLSLPQYGRSRPSCVLRERASVGGIEMLGRHRRVSFAPILSMEAEEGRDIPDAASPRLEAQDANEAVPSTPTLLSRRSETENVPARRRRPAIPVQPRTSLLQVSPSADIVPMAADGTKTVSLGDTTLPTNTTDCAMSSVAVVLPPSEISHKQMNTVPRWSFKGLAGASGNESQLSEENTSGEQGSGSRKNTYRGSVMGIVSPHWHEVESSPRRQVPNKRRSLHARSPTTSTPLWLPEETREKRKTIHGVIPSRNRYSRKSVVRDDFSLYNPTLDFLVP